MNTIEKIVWKIIALAFPEKYARHIGVNIGKHCLIRTTWWTSEPYLITIGDHVQITDDVSFHTHGEVVREL